MRRLAATFALLMGIAMIGAPTASAAPDEISISCIDWFFSGGHQDHIHVELYLVDRTGRPVVGATVRFTTSYDAHDGNPPVVYATNTGDTRDKPGKNRGKGCPGGIAPRSGSTGFFCCAGAAMWSGETPPGKRACPAGLYTVNVQSITAPPGSNLVWDGVTPANGVEFSPSHD